MPQGAEEDCSLKCRASLVAPVAQVTYMWALDFVLQWSPRLLLCNFPEGMRWVEVTGGGVLLSKLNLVPVIVTSRMMPYLSSAFDPSSPDGQWATVGSSVAVPGNHWLIAPSSKPEYWMPSREAMGAILTVFGVTQLGIEPIIYQSRGAHSITRPLSLSMGYPVHGVSQSRLLRCVT